MNQGKRLSLCVIFLCYLFFGLFAICMFKTDYNQEELYLYITLCGAYIICGTLIIIAIFKHRLYLFEPFSFVSFWYIAIFIYRPFSDLYYGRTDGNGVSVIGGGAKATILFIVGYIFLYVGYFFNIKYKFSVNKKDNVKNNIKTDDKNINDNNWALIGWIISFILCLVAMISNGISLQYIFSLAREGERIVDESNVALLFLSNFGATLATCWLLVIVGNYSKGIKIAITILSAIYLIIRNARWLMLIFIVAPVVYYYIRKKKNPNPFIIFGGGILLLIIFAWMQYNRTNIATGNEMVGFGERWLTLDVLLSPFDSDLSTYKVFYSMVKRYPAEHFYMLGATFLYTFILFVPRALWHTKPDNPVRDMIENSMNSLSRKSGSAVANIGELYANFGIIGICIGMFIFGKILSKMKKLYVYPTQDSLIAYAILWPLLFQWVARGNFSGNFYVTIFAMLPFICKYLLKHIRKVR